MLDDHASVNQSLSRLLGQVQGKSCPLVGGHLRQAVRHRSGDVDLLTILPFVGLYAAAMRAVHEIASRPAPDENLPTPTAPARRGRPPRQPQPAPREAQASQLPADSKPAAKRRERGSNARFVEEALRARAALAVRPAEIRAALQHHKGVSLAFTSIRHALGQLAARKAVEQDGNGG